MAKRNYKLINPNPSPVDRALDGSRAASAAEDRVGNPLGRKVAPDKQAARTISSVIPPALPDLDRDHMDSAVDVTGTLWNADARGNLGRSSLETRPFGNHPYAPDPPGARSAGIDTGKQHIVGDGLPKGDK